MENLFEVIGAELLKHQEWKFEFWEEVRIRFFFFFWNDIRQVAFVKLQSHFVVVLLDFACFLWKLHEILGV